MGIPKRFSPSVGGATNPCQRKFDSSRPDPGQPTNQPLAEVRLYVCHRKKDGGYLEKGGNTNIRVNFSPIKPPSQLLGACCTLLSIRPERTSVHNYVKLARMKIFQNKGLSWVEQLRDVNCVWKIIRFPVLFGLTWRSCSSEKLRGKKKKKNQQNQCVMMRLDLTACSIHLTWQLSGRISSPRCLLSQ